MAKKGARQSASSAGRRRGQDSAMAAGMRHVKRDVLRCPICNAIVSLGAFYMHVAVHR